jgi:hypothetical protein
MRGLTPAERDVLAFMLAGDDGTHIEIPFPSEHVEATVESMVAQGRIRTFTREEEDGWHDIYTPTDAGRLALRLWPATMATPGGGDRP